MKKSNILLIVFILILFAQNVSASALVGPSCFVIAEIDDIGSEMKKLDSGKEYESHYLNIKILNILSGDTCPVQINQVYQVIDNHPGTFQKGDRIKAGIELGSSMGPAGAVSFLQWSSLTHENGTNIQSKYNNAIITHLQSDSKPTSIAKDADLTDYLYILILLLGIIIAGYLIYRFKFKRSAH